MVFQLKCRQEVMLIVALTLVFLETTGATTHGARARREDRRPLSRSHSSQARQALHQRREAGSVTHRWGPWTTWSSCSKTCGSGVAFRQRQCHTYPRYAVAHCDGEPKEFKVCNLQECARPVDFRKKACTQQNSRYYGSRRYHWDPYINPYNRCEIACKARGHRYYARFKGVVEDGTSCRKEIPAVCLHGECKDVGCDDVIGSGATVDRCGQCGGDNTSCRMMSAIFTRTQFPQYGHNSVTRIPAGACAINITELGRSRNHLAVRQEDGVYILNGNGLQPVGNYPGAGTVFQYRRRSGPYCPGECLLVKGPINQTIELQVIYYGRNPGIMYEFTVPNNMVDRVLKTMMAKDDQEDSGLSSGSLDNSRLRHHRRRHQQRRQRLIPRRPTPQPTFWPHEGGDVATDQHGGTGGGVPLAVPLGQQSDGARGGNRRIIRNFALPGTGREQGGGLDRLQFGQAPHYIPQTDPASSNVQQLQTSRGTQTDQSRQSARGSYGSRPLTSTNDVDVERQTPRFTYQTSLADNVIPNGGTGSGQAGVGTGVATGSDVFNAVQTPSRTVATYVWRITGLSQCSVTCGAGVQRTEVVCFEEPLRLVVTDENCNAQTKPQAQVVSCSTNRPCPASWEADAWTECSRTCGRGMQTRKVECRQYVSPSLQLAVSASQCQEAAARPASIQTCQNQPCAAWQSGNWSKCTAECGFGERRRSVQCLGVEGSPVEEAECQEPKPAHKEVCDMGSCAQGWYYSRWSKQCSAKCGKSHRERKIYCAADNGQQLPDSKCSVRDKPRSRRTCRQQPCGGTWFRGPWAKCNATCGEGVQQRDVLCVKRLGNKLQAVVSEENCVAERRPKDTQRCRKLKPCKPEWFMTPWTKCSKSCGTGVQTREVKCLDKEFRASLDCPKKRRPLSRQTCNKQACEAPTPGVQSPSPQPDTPRSTTSPSSESDLQKDSGSGTVPPPKAAASLGKSAAEARPADSKQGERKN